MMLLPPVVHMQNSYSNLLFMQPHLVFFGLEPEWLEHYNMQILISDHQKLADLVSVRETPAVRILNPVNDKFLKYKLEGDIT